MATIITRTNFAGIYYNLVRKAGANAERVELAYHVPLPKGETELQVDIDGEFQITFVDLENYYGGGSFGVGFDLAGDATKVVEYIRFDADGNDIKPNRPVTDPITPTPKTPEEPEPEPDSEPEPEPAPMGVFEKIYMFIRAIFVAIFSRK